MSTDEIKAKMDELVNLLKYHQHKYYILDEPEITDAEYDQLYRALLELERAHPGKRRLDSPTFQVGYPIGNSSFEPVVHYKPLLSLGNIFNEDELDQFIETLPKDSTIIGELKLDGLAVALTYENRKLVKAATRGDGTTGEDITANIRTIRSVPLWLDSYFPHTEFEIHGEVTMPWVEFDRLNEELKQAGKKPFANPRNAAAGSLRQKDPEKTKWRKLRFNPYGWDERYANAMSERMSREETEEEINSYSYLHYMLGLSFDNRATLTMKLNSKEEIQKYYLKAIELRSELGYDIDGVVIKLNGLEARKALGERNREPRWATAYKFPAGTAVTVLEAVDWQIGRTGVLTPVARLKSVPLMGVTVSNCTLHNLDEINRLDLRVGDTVTLSRQGDVIPKITHVFHDLRPLGAVNITHPDRCPYCSFPTHYAIGNPFVRCRNTGCSGILKAKVAYHVSRECFDIDGLGEQITSALVDIDTFKENIFDLFDTNVMETAMSVAGLGTKVISNILEEIERKRTMRLDRLIASLGIPSVAGSTAKLIANFYRTVDNFVYRLEMALLNKSLLAEITDIHGIGDATVADWIKGLTEIPTAFEDPTTAEEFLASGHGAPVIQLPPLAELVLKAIKNKVIVVTDMPEIKSDLAGQTFVITGSFEMNRTLIKEKLTLKGAKVTGTVSDKTTALIAGENAGSKLKKAQSLGIKIITEAELKDLLQ